VRTARSLEWTVGREAEGVREHLERADGTTINDGIPDGQGVSPPHRWGVKLRDAC
jgi:hypothetical protein